MEPMNRSDVQAWLDRYVAAWRANDRGRSRRSSARTRSTATGPGTATSTRSAAATRSSPAGWRSRTRRTAGTRTTSRSRSTATGRSPSAGAATRRPTTSRSALPQRVPARFAPDGRCTSFHEFYMLRKGRDLGLARGRRPGLGASLRGARPDHRRSGARRASRSSTPEPPTAWPTTSETTCGSCPADLVAAINTHGHWDHAFGNARFAPSRSGATSAAPTSSSSTARPPEPASSRNTPRRRRLPRSRAHPADIVRGDRGSSISAIASSSCATSDAGTPTTTSSCWSPTHRSCSRATSSRTRPPRPSATASRSHGRPPGAPSSISPTGRSSPATVTRSTSTSPSGRSRELALLAQLARDAVSGAIGPDEAVRRSPFPSHETGDALERARLELE